MLRAEGNAAKASFGVSLGGIFNILLDPLLILPQFAGMGAAGAGLATAISNTVSVLYFLCITQRACSDSMLRLKRPIITHIRMYAGEILSIGFPSALQYALTVVAVAAQAKFVSHYPTQAVAALGITKKLDQLPLYFSIGVASGLMPFLAYNHAAGNHARRKQAFRFGTGISFAFALLILILFELFAPFFGSLFISDETTINYTASFLRRMVTAMPLMSICYPMIIQFQAMGKAKEALACSVLRKGVLDIPLLYLMDQALPLYGLMWVQPIVDATSLLVCLLLYRRLMRSEPLKNI
jgi:Na+-driven multidrug efflux pump